MEIKKIYFDMDGVLADFNLGLKELCGIEPLDQESRAPAQDDEMWQTVKNIDHFYDRLKPMPGALKMFEALSNEYGERCEILSGIPKPHRKIAHAGEDKTSWAHRLLSKDLKVNIVYREEKKNYCKGPEYILIDDLSKNIKEWEASGGTGILFTSAEDVLAKIDELKKL